MQICTGICAQRKKERRICCVSLASYGYYMLTGMISRRYSFSSVSVSSWFAPMALVWLMALCSGLNGRFERISRRRFPMRRCCFSHTWKDMVFGVKNAYFFSESDGKKWRKNKCARFLLWKVKYWFSVLRYGFYDGVLVREGVAFLREREEELLLVDLVGLVTLDLDGNGFFS